MEGESRNENAPAVAGHNGGFSKTGRARTRCPHCQCAADIRSSREITATHREIYYRCTNLFCGHAWRASESYDWGLTPSAIPNPAVDLPLRVPTRQEVIDLLRARNAAQPGLFDANTPTVFEPPG